MGKILTYLGIEEAGQTRDILDAERLLEGMQSLYANSPEGKKKDAFAVPLAEMTKTFIEKVKGIKPKEQPKEQPQEQEVESGDVTTELVDWFVDFQQFFLKNEEVTPRIVLDNETFQKKYILWMQKAVLSLFQSSKEKQKRLKDYLVTLNDNEENRTEFHKILISKQDEVIEGIEFDYMLLYNFLGLYNVLGQEAKENLVEAYKIIGNNYLNPALFENEMEASEATPQESASATTLPSFIKPISEKEQKPSKPSKPTKPKFKVGDKYSALLGNTEVTLTIKKVDIDFIEIEVKDGPTHSFEINQAEGYVKKGVWKKIEKPQEQPQEVEFKVGDVYFSEAIKQNLTITEVGQSELIVRYEDGTEDDKSKVYCKLLVKRKDWVKVEKPQEQTQDSELNVGDVYYVDLLKQNLTITAVEGDFIDVYYDNGNIDTKTIEYARLMIKLKGWVKVEKPQEEQNGVYKVGDKFITGDNKDLIFTIDFIKYSNIGLIYEDGLTANLERKDFEKGLKSGYYKPYTETQDENDLYFKEDDGFIDKKTKKQYQIYKVNKNNGFVDLYNINSKGNVIDKEVLTIEYVQASIKKGDWIKIDANATKPIKPRKPRTPTTLTEKDKQIKHILDINIDDIDL